ncbi:hypothetical protein BC830DRAFT_1078711 [Chytriomyces sp. MP71]|nr:hypothetical protein BC830DRAFT_1078711 [Chytriomyces sp. MP71]
MSLYDFASSANVTASTFDSVSAACKPNLCNPKESTDDGQDTGGMDKTQWQSAPQFGSPCSPVWIQYDMSAQPPGQIGNFSLLYGNTSFLFDGQPQGSVKMGPAVSLISSSGQSLDAKAGVDYTFTSTVSSNEDAPARFDAFIPLSDLLKTNVNALRFTWSNLVPVGAAQLCQINVEEAVIYGSKSTALSSASVPASSTGTGAITSEANSGSGGLGSGAIAGIITGVVVVAVAAVIMVVRRRNTQKRRANTEIAMQQAASA